MQLLHLSSTFVFSRLCIKTHTFPKVKEKKSGMLFTKPLILKNSISSSTTTHHHNSPNTLRLPALLVTTLFLQFFIIFTIFRHPPPLPSTAHDSRHDHQCIYGKVFMYDLPPMFNKDLLTNCHELDPWTSRCAAVSNGGFGPLATELEAVVPKDLLPAWYWTDMYSSEVIYHRKMMNYTCRTTNPQLATAFYIPFYAGLSVGKYLWSHGSLKDLDRDSEMLVNWLKDQPYFKRRNGSDHFIVLGRLTWDFRRLSDDDSDWGSKLAMMPLMKNVLTLCVEKSPWDHIEVSVPYPNSFHPRSSSDILEWQNFVRAQRRTKLFSFAGTARPKYRNDFRGLLMNYCRNESGVCRYVDCSMISCNKGTPEILETFLDSDFCLQPRGDGSTRRSIFDCLVAGSIPVYFWKDSFDGQYNWHVKFSGMTSSSYIHHDDVRNDTSLIRKVLEGYSKEKVKRMRETVIEMIPRLVYSLPNEGLKDSKDAFDLAIEGVLRKFKRQLSMQQQQQNDWNTLSF